MKNSGTAKKPSGKQAKSKKAVDNAASGEVSSGASMPAAAPAEAPAIPPAETPAEPAEGKDTKVTLTLKGLDKRQRNAIYTGAAVSIRIPVGAFPEKTAPATWEAADGVFAGRKERLTAEQRKEARKNAPKLTLAEKVAAAEKRAAALRAKLAGAEAEAAAAL